jgi:hypothetical protein
MRNRRPQGIEGLVFFLRGAFASIDAKSAGNAGADALKERVIRRHWTVLLRRANQLKT